MEDYHDVVIVGGGAAGFFTAINLAEQQPLLKILLLEKAKEGLQKVKISGGGRCNVTHAEFIPQELVGFYPRGEKELLGPFHSFMTGDTMEWFESRGVPLKIEEDGRIFPVSNSSQSIIDCFLKEIKKHKVKVEYASAVSYFEPQEQGFVVHTAKGLINCTKLIICTGSSPKFWKILKSLGHTIVSPVPSLFTFDISDSRIKDIPGVVVKDVEVEVLGSKLKSEGPLLVTHVGLSAPSILKLSAFGAIELAERHYNFKIRVNFIRKTPEETLKHLKTFKKAMARKNIYNTPLFEIPKRLWKNLSKAALIPEDMKWANLDKNQLDQLSLQLTTALFQVKGKSTFKEEFVTAGGVDLTEVNFKTFESKLIPNLYFAGEVLNIDAVTGGFNFQNAWTGGFVVSRSISMT